MSTETDPAAAPPLVIAAGNGQAPIPSPTAAADAAGGPSAEQVANALDGSLAAKLRAKHAEIQKGTKEFEVPGWDGELLLTAKVIRDRKRLTTGLTNEQLIIDATVGLIYVDDGQRREITNGWAGVGQLMGLSGDQVTTGEIVRLVLDNPLRLDGFAEKLISWIMGHRSAVEQVLGE